MVYMGYGNEEKEYNCGLCTFMFSPHLWLMFILGLYIYVCIYTHTHVYIYAYIYTHYCCSNTVVSIFIPPQPPTPPIPASQPQTYPLWLCPCVLYTCSLMDLPLFSPIIPLPPTPLVTVSLFFISTSLVPFLCFCVLLISFHL